MSRLFLTLLFVFVALPARAENFAACNSGLAAEEAGDYALAIERVSACIQTGGLHRASLAQAYYDRARAWYLRERTDEALADYGNSLATDPDFVPAYYARGGVFTDMGQFERAEGDFTSALRRDPAYARAYIGRGTALLGRAALDDAERDFQTALSLDATPEAHGGLGKVHFRQGRVSEAIADYGAAIALDKDYVEAYVGRARALHRQGDYPAAMEDATRAARLNPDDPDIRAERAQLFDLMGEHERADQEREEDE